MGADSTDINRVATADFHQLPLDTDPTMAMPRSSLPNIAVVPATMTSPPPQPSTNNVSAQQTTEIRRDPNNNLVGFQSVQTVFLLEGSILYRIENGQKNIEAFVCETVDELEKLFSTYIEGPPS